jgi:predicted amidohydrolase YtcJ
MRGLAGAPESMDAIDRKAVVVMSGMRRRIHLFFLPFLLLSCISGCIWKNRSADLILKNGVFFTGNPMKPFAEMVAIRGNRIVGVGKSSDIHRHLRPTTRVIDCGGRFGCAGFNDSHVHLVAGGRSLEDVDFTGVSSELEMQKRILERAWKLPWGSWILGRGWDQNLFPGGRWPTKKILDDIAPDYPMVFHRVCGHAVLVNSKVLEIAGITATTPDPAAGEIVRDPATGEPTGVLKEEAVRLVSQYIPAPTRESIQRAVERGLEAARRFGVTSVQDQSVPEAIPVYRDMLAEETLTCRISIWFPLAGDWSEYRRQRAEFNGLALHFGPLKGFIDGTLGTRTALLLEPYADDATSRGTVLITPQSLSGYVAEADSAGYQIALHAIGDGAVRMALDAFAQPVAGRLEKDRRYRIEHAQVVSESDLGRFKSLGVIASMQPAHCSDDLAWAGTRLGPERSRGAYAWNSLLRAGVRLAFGSDWPVASLNPMTGLYAAVTRTDTAGLPEGGWNYQEHITVEEAILAYTAGSAAAEFMENEKGTLEQGKLADLVLFDRNLLTCAPRDLLRTRVVCTLMNGKIVYEENP